MRTGVVAIALLILGASSSVAAAPIFEQVGTTNFGNEGLFTGASSEAMGDATVAAPRGAAGALLNPASLAQVDGAELSYAQMPWFDSHAKVFAAAFGWSSMRVSFVRNQLDMDIDVRSAFDPAGVRTAVENHIDVANLSYSRRFEVGSTTVLTAAVGANYRRFYFAADPSSDSEVSVNTMDLGSSWGLSSRSPLLDYALSLGIAVSNVTRAESEFSGRNALAPAPLRYGAQLDVAWRSEATLPPLLRTRLAYAHTHTRDSRSSDFDHWGLELMTLDRFALRVGQDGSFGLGERRVGAGLLLGENGTGSLRGSVDWTRVIVEEDSIFGKDLDLWGFTLILGGP